MFTRRFMKVFLGLALLLGIRSTMPVNAQTSGEPEQAGATLCSQNGISRYEAWVKDIPCSAALSTMEDTASYTAPAGDPGVIQSETPTNADYTYAVFSSYRDGNYEIYGNPYPWSYDGLRYSIRMTNDPSSDLRPRLRPGTTQIIFGSYRTGDYELFLMDWGGGNLQRLTSNPAYDSQAAWSPDGKKIAFASDRDGNLEIYVMLADGSGLTRLTNDAADDFTPYWSPDGSQIIWVRAVSSEYATLYAMNADGSNPHTLTSPLRYLGHPSWSSQGDLIAFDSDANLDGWNDLGVMNADGSNLHTVANGSYLIDYWAGSWPMVQRYELLYTCITYIVYKQQLYISHAEIGRYNLNEGGGGAFSYSNLDFYPDSAMIDITIPDTHVEPLPEYSRAGDIPITVVGTDPGPATIYDMYLQNRLGLAGDWQDLYAYPYVNQYTYTYTAQAGAAVYFRSRGWDWADHYEDWPPGDGDTFTQVYAWQLAGNITDNRGTGIALAAAHTEPVFSDQANASYLGKFHRYIPSSPVTVTVSGTGYGSLPDAYLSSQVDLAYTWVLPPQADLLENGDFEAGLTGWLDIGNFTPVLDTSTAHTGLASGGLGLPNLGSVTENLSNNAGESYQPRSAVDPDGTLHVIWIDYYTDYKGSVYYSQKPITGTWTTPVMINPGHTSNSWLPEVAMGQNGTLYAVWLDGAYDNSNIFYAARTPGGTWSTPASVSGTRNIWEPIAYSRPDVAVDSLNTVHVVWADQDGLWYIDKPAAGSWSAPLKIGDMYSPHAISMGPDDTLHVVISSDVITYKNRSSGGVWGSPVEVAASIPNQIELAADASGQVHLFWLHDYNATFYAVRSTAGVWTTTNSITGGDLVDQIALSVTGDLAHLMWRGDHGLRYRGKFEGGAWSPIMDVTSGNLFLGIDLLAQGDHIRAFWSAGDGFNCDILYSQWEFSQAITSSLSQAVFLPGQLHQPTLSFLYNSTPEGTGGGFHVDINGAPVFSATEASNGWVHQWIDLSPWLSQTITITFRADSDLTQGLFSAHIDDVSLGAWLSPVVEMVDPGQVEAWTPITLTITGENFVVTPTIRLNDQVFTNVEMLDDYTLRLVIPEGLAPGTYDVWVINPGGQEGVKQGGVRVGRFVFLPVLRK